MKKNISLMNFVFSIVDLKLFIRKKKLWTEKISEWLDNFESLKLVIDWFCKPTTGSIRLAYLSSSYK